MRYIGRKTVCTRRLLASLVVIFIISSVIHVSTSAADSLNIPLTVKETAGVGAHEYPIIVVVPLEKGRYQDVDSFRVVDASENTVPAQFEVLNRWWSIDHSIRHIAVHFQPTVSAFTGSGTGLAEYYLRDDGDGNYSPQPIALTETASDITVNTGVLQFVVKKDHFNILDRVWLDLNDNQIFESDEEVISSSLLHGGRLVPRQENTTGPQYDSARTDVSVEIEENGPMRVVIRAEALTEYNAPTDHTHGWAVRIYAYAGKPYVKIDYQLQNSAKNVVYAWPLYFESLDLNFTLNLGDNPIVKFGTGDGTVYERARNEGLFLTQNMHDTFKVVDTGNHDTLHSGTIPDGFISVNDGQKGVTAIIRNFWQMWPNGLNVDSHNTLSLQLFPDWSAQFSYNDDKKTYEINETGLYWLEDMQQTYKETLLFFHKASVNDTELIRLAKTFQYHPVGAIPTDHYRQTQVTLDLDGVLPETVASPTDNTRIPAYESSAYDLSSKRKYQFGWDNFKAELPRKIKPNQTGGWPKGNVQFIVTENPADYFDAEDFAMGELNVMPQWMAGYTHEHDWSFLNLSDNPYGGGSWRKFSGKSTPKGATAVPYLDGTAKDAKARDDQHGWFYHVEDAYLLTGNLWIKDWYKFIAEYRQVQLNHLDPWPDKSDRAIGHSLGHALQAYRVTGNSALLPEFREYLKWLWDEKHDPQYGWKTSMAFMSGFLTRSLIDYMEEIHGVDWQAYAEAFQIVSACMAWNLHYGNFGYKVAEGEIGASSGTGLTLVDPQMWYSRNTGKQEFFDHVEQYLADGINGGKKPYGDFTQWKGQYEGRYYLWAKNTSRNDSTPPSSITDLKAVRSGSDLLLTWTAPQDNDLERYHIVWSTQPISEPYTPDSQQTNWWAAHVVGPDLVPEPGTEQTLLLPSVPAEPVYVAIFTFDTQQNMSTMSNLAPGSGID